MTELAVAADCRPILGLVLVVVTAHASRRVDVHFVVRIRAEAHFHRGKHVVSIGVLQRGRRPIDRLLIDRAAVRRIESFETASDWAVAASSLAYVAVRRRTPSRRTDDSCRPTNPTRWRDRRPSAGWARSDGQPRYDSRCSPSIGRVPPASACSVVFGVTYSFTFPLRR